MRLMQGVTIASSASPKLRLAFGVFVALSLSCCSSTATSPSPNLSVTRLSSSAGSLAYISGYQQPATLVIRSNDELASAWAIIYSGFNAAPPVPTVDFTKQMVVGVAIGLEPTGGFNVVISGVTEVNGGVTVDATVTTPGPSCAVTTAVTEPVDLAQIPVMSGPITFEKITKTNSC